MPCSVPRDPTTVKFICKTFQSVLARRQIQGGQKSIVNSRVDAEMGLVEHRPPFVHRVGWFEPSSTAVNAQFSAILSTISTEAAGYCTMNNVLQQQQISGRVVFFSRGAALSCYRWPAAISYHHLPYVSIDFTTFLLCVVPYTVKV